MQAGAGYQQEHSGAVGWVGGPPGRAPGEPPTGASCSGHCMGGLGSPPRGRTVRSRSNPPPHPSPHCSLPCPLPCPAPPPPPPHPRFTTLMPPCCVSTGTALTAVVAARVPSGGAISPLAGPPELEDALDAQRERVRTVSIAFFHMCCQTLWSTFTGCCNCNSHAAGNLLVSMLLVTCW